MSGRTPPLHCMYTYINRHGGTTNKTKQKILIVVWITAQFVTLGLRLVVVVVESHIQRIGCKPEKTALHGGQSRSCSAEQGEKIKIKVWQRNPPPSHAARSEEIKNKIKITRRIHLLSRRDAGRRYAGLGPSRVHSRVPTTRRLGWVI